VKTGFREHLAGALIAGAAFAYILHSELGYSLDSLIAPFLLFAVSAMLPDIDSPVSRPRKYFRYLLLIWLAIISVAYYSTLSSIHFLVPFAFPVLGYFAIDLLIPKHRGVMHSGSVALAWGAVIFLLMRSPVAGLAAAFGYGTHLLIDFLGDRI